MTRCVNLRPHEVVRLLSAGECLIVRPVKPQPPPNSPERFPGHTDSIHEVRCAVWRGALAAKVPFGPPGTRLAGRETWGHQSDGNLCHEPSCDNPDHCWYKADERDPGIWPTSFWHSAATMPINMGRFFFDRDGQLVTVDTAVKRVQAIDKYEAEEAGWQNSDGTIQDANGDDVVCPKACAELALERFVAWWDKSFRGSPWQQNPWAWFCSVRREPVPAAGA